MVTLKKFKKIWKKSFSDEELIAINRKIQDFSNEISLHMFNSDLTIPKDFNQSRITFAYLETDRWDGSEGISPKQLKKLINIWGDNYIIALWCLSFLSSKYLLNEVFEEDEDEDNVRIVSYKELLKLDDFKVFFEDIDKSLNFTFDKLLDITSNEVSMDAVKNLLFMYFYKNIDESLVNLNNDELLKLVASKWKKINNLIPRNNYLMLSIDPIKWNAEGFIGALNHFYSTKQFAKISESNQVKFINFYKKTGSNTSLLYELLGDQIIDLNVDLSKIEYDQKAIAFLQKIFEKEDKLDFSSKIALLQVANEEKIRNIYKESKDISLILGVQEYSDLFGIMPFEKILDLKKFNFHRNTINEMLRIYNETTNIKTTIPLSGGIISKEYRWEILSKSNFDSILAGNYTQCCQNVNGAGKTCVTIGAYRENITIFAVYKNDTMVCQSMLWKADDYIVADSIESVSSGYTEYIEKAYIELAEHFEDNDLELIFGATSRLGSNNLTTGHREEIVSKQQYIPDIYSDASLQQRLKGKNE